MDLSTNEELMGMQNTYVTEYGSHVFKMKETFEETDIKGNNNLFNSLKTEKNGNHGNDDPSSLFQVKCTTEKKLEIDNSLFSYSSFKKAMDLRTHNRTVDGSRRTIFDDAEYFAKNYCYKLLPITFEQVDETIIQSEHNYSLSSLNSESEPEEDCSRTMDYSQVKEKNYKRRRTKFQEEEMVESGTSDGERKSEVESSQMFFHQNEDFGTEFEDQNASVSVETENSASAQPLDLSASPVVQEEKTDPHLRERPNSIAKNDEITQPDSDKENMNSELNGIRVTITRPDEKENYQPCDLFLNDIARLVPWLIDKDCFEVDILDRTCDRHEFQNHRLYYVISESTWRLFQGTNERVILTNDQSLGQPLRKPEKDEKPSYLVFDQFSLAKCLADYCQEIGGCFEYTCVEEGKEEERSEEGPGDEEKKILETVEEVEKVNEVAESVSNVGEVKEEENRNGEMTGKEEEEKKTVEEEQKKPNEILEKSSEMTEGMEKEKKGEDSEVIPSKEKHLEKEKETVIAPDSEEKIHKKRQKAEPKAADKDVRGGKVATIKEVKKQGRGFKHRNKSPIQPEPKNLRITTRSKSTSESETSQKSDKPVIRKERKKRGSPTPSKEPPKKRNRPADTEDLRRKTRSGKMLGEVDTKKSIEKRKRSRRLGREKLEEEEEKKEPARKLRSQKVVVGREKTNCRVTVGSSSKSKTRKR